jgi:hypothetical protein
MRGSGVYIRVDDDCYANANAATNVDTAIDK